MGETVGELVEWSARNYPDKTALVYEYGDKVHRWTYRQLNEHVNRFAHALHGLGVKKGDVISTFLYNTSEFVVALFAGAQVGAIVNPINYRLASRELQYILNDAQTKVILFETMGSEVVEQVRSLGVDVRHYVYVDRHIPDYALDFYSLLEGQPTVKPSVDVGEEDDFLLLYTSGTTGKPKGVLHTHRSKIHHNLIMMQAMGIHKDDIGLSAAPLNHTAELNTTFLPRVHVGATNVLLHHFDPSDVLRTIEREKVTLMFAAPTMVNMLLNDERFSDYDLSSLRLLEYGGASMAPALIREFQEKVGADLVQIYGTTEMGPCMSVLYPDEQLLKAGSAGKVTLTHELIIAKVNDNGEPTDPSDECSIGEEGEILVRGPCMMKGYLNRPEATEKALYGGWYHTGDIGVVDVDGYLWIKDRIDHMIVSGAENIYPREVEDALIEHPDVLETAVVGKPDPLWGEVVCAFVVPKKDRQLHETDLDAFLQQSGTLSRYKRPRYYHFVSELPKTASGKIQKFVLERMLEKVKI